MERLQKYLSECGVASRRKCEEIIVAGRVKVNGEVVTELGTKVSKNDKIELDDKYYERIKEGFRQVLFLGTGYGYTDIKYKPAGKTGTSESFLDIDNDGVNDVKTITSTYAMFAPYDDPVYAVALIVEHGSSGSAVAAPIGSEILKEAIILDAAR